MLPVPCLISLFTESSADEYSKVIRTGMIFLNNLAQDDDTEFVDTNASSRFAISLINFYL